MHAQPPTRAHCNGLVLAGGRGARMGNQDKGLLLYDKLPLVEHALMRLRPQVIQVAVCANRHLDQYRAFGAPVITDDTDTLEPFSGPLAGVLAGLHWSTQPWLVVVPCDAPLFPLNLCTQLAAAIQHEHAAVAVTDDGIQPVFCLLHVSLADQLAESLQHGERKMENWLRSVGAAYVPFGDAAAFANINAPDDLR